MSGFDLSGPRRELLRRLLAEQGAVDSGYAATSAGDIVRRTEEGPPPLSFAQERMWLSWRLDPESAAYNLPAVVRMRGSLDADAFEAALFRVLDRHQVLRTLLQDEGGRTVGHLTSEAGRLSRHDVTAEPDPQVAALALVQSIIELPFDLSSGPLTRAVLVRTEPDEHLLVLDMHHVAGDAWSWDVLLAQLASEVTGESAPPAQQLQYADFAAWQRERLERGDWDGQLTYWRKQLRGLPAPLDIVGDRPRSLRPRYRGAVLRADVDHAVAVAVRDLAIGSRTTPFVVCLTAWFTLLYRVSGEHDLLVGTPVAERRHRALDDLVGIFVNTLALRARVHGAAEFRALLADVHGTVLAAGEHQEVPFDRVVREALPTRDAAPQLPLFHIMFVYRSAPERSSVAGLLLTEVEVHNRTSKRDLTLQIVETAGALRLQLEYDTDRYDTASAQALLDAFRTMLGAAVADPDRRVDTLPLLDAAAEAAERDVGLGDALEPTAGTVLDLIREQATATPKRAAVRDADSTLSYAELVHRADATARTLVAAGVEPGATVGVLMARSADSIVAVLAVLAARAAYVPLDPLDPWQRVNGLVAAARVTAVLTDDLSAAAEGLAADVDVLPVADSSDPAAPRPPVDLPRPEDTAYVLFTSGSTGTPKGVVVEHRQLLAYTRAVALRLDLAGPLEHALVQPLGVDSSLTMVFPPLCHGGTVNVVAREVSLDPAALARLFAERGIDTLKIAPSHLRALHRAGDVDALLPRRCLVVGGEGSAQYWLESLDRPGLAVHNHYGPTETTVGVTTLRVSPSPTATDPAVITPLGNPLPGVSAHVLDERLRVVPRGVVGELHLGGTQVARGYAGLPDRTAQAFVPDPFGPPGSRLYRTGDRARRRPDGVLEFLGRDDDQVKIRGLRVEPGEVTAVLRAQPDVADAVVVAERIRAGARLVGVFVPTGSHASQEDDAVGAVDAGALRERLRALLPEPLVPAVLVAVSALPLSAHGKVDRAALVEIARGAGPSSPGLRKPSGELERAVAEVWRRVLGDDDVAADVNFFDAGGHSLLLVQLHHELQALAQHDIALVELFNRPTVERQAELLRDDYGDDRDARLARGRERGRQQSAASRARRQADRPRAGRRDERPR